MSIEIRRFRFGKFAVIALFLLIVLVAIVLATVGLVAALMVGVGPGLGLIWVLQMVQRDLGPGGVPITRAKEKRLRRARRRSRSYKEDE